MNGESESEGFETDAVRCAAVSQPEARDERVGTIRDDGIAEGIEAGQPERVGLVSRDRFADLVFAGRELIAGHSRARNRAWLIVEPAAPDVREEHAANPADDADRRQRRF